MGVAVDVAVAVVDGNDHCGWNGAGLSSGAVVGAWADRERVQL